MSDLSPPSLFSVETLLGTLNCAIVKHSLSHPVSKSLENITNHEATSIQASLYLLENDKDFEEEFLFSLIESVLEDHKVFWESTVQSFFQKTQQCDRLFVLSRILTVLRRFPLLKFDQLTMNGHFWKILRADLTAYCLEGDFLAANERASTTSERLTLVFVQFFPDLLTKAISKSVKDFYYYLTRSSIFHFRFLPLSSGYNSLSSNESSAFKLHMALILQLPLVDAPLLAAQTFVVSELSRLLKSAISQDPPQPSQVHNYGALFKQLFHKSKNSDEESKDDPMNLLVATFMALENKFSELGVDSPVKMWFERDFLKAGTEVDAVRMPFIFLQRYLRALPIKRATNIPAIGFNEPVLSLLYFTTLSELSLPLPDLNVKQLLSSLPSIIPFLPMTSLRHISRILSSYSTHIISPQHKQQIQNIQGLVKSLTSTVDALTEVDSTIDSLVDHYERLGKVPLKEVDSLILFRKDFYMEKILPALVSMALSFQKHLRNPIVIKRITGAQEILRSLKDAGKMPKSAWTRYEEALSHSGAVGASQAESLDHRQIIQRAEDIITKLRRDCNMDSNLEKYLKDFATLSQNLSSKIQVHYNTSNMTFTGVTSFDVELIELWSQGLHLVFQVSGSLATKWIDLFVDSKLLQIRVWMMLKHQIAQLHPSFLPSLGFSLIHLISRENTDEFISCIFGALEGHIVHLQENAIRILIILLSTWKPVPLLQQKVARLSRLARFLWNRGLDYCDHVHVFLCNSSFGLLDGHFQGLQQSRESGDFLDWFEWEIRLDSKDLETVAYRRRIIRKYANSSVKSAAQNDFIVLLLHKVFALAVMTDVDSVSLLSLVVEEFCAALYNNPCWIQRSFDSIMNETSKKEPEILSSFYAACLAISPECFLLGNLSERVETTGSAQRLKESLFFANSLLSLKSGSRLIQTEFVMHIWDRLVRNRYELGFVVEVPLFLSNVLASLVTRKCLEAQEPIRSAVEFLQLFSDPKIPKLSSLPRDCGSIVESIGTCMVDLLFELTDVKLCRTLCSKILCFISSSDDDCRLSHHLFVRVLVTLTGLIFEHNDQNKVRFQAIVYNFGPGEATEDPMFDMIKVVALGIVYAKPNLLLNIDRGNEEMDRLLLVWMLVSSEGKLLRHITSIREGALINVLVDVYVDLLTQVEDLEGSYKFVSDLRKVLSDNAEILKNCRCNTAVGQKLEVEDRELAYILFKPPQKRPLKASLDANILKRQKL